MNITNIPDVTTGYSMQSNRSNNLMTQTIKDYEDEYYTELTDEEREVIDKQVRAYLSKIKPGCKVNMDELKSLIQRLLDEYGYRGNMDILELSCSITNTGSVFGKEIAQLYVRRKNSTVLHPEKELKGFLKPLSSLIG